MNCLTTMYLCDLVGLARFSNATGIINLFRGFGCFLGPFLAGEPFIIIRCRVSALNLINVMFILLKEQSPIDSEK